MTPEQAAFTRQMMCQGAEREQPVTRNVIAAVPESGVDYKPHEKSMTALDLAYHLVASEVWFLNGIANGAFEPGEGGRPAEIKKVEDVLAFYDKEFPAALDKVKALSPEKLAQPVDFYGIFNLPAVAYMGFMNSHSIHHRGQLSVYLRPMGSKVPSIYGGSADEPFQATA